MSDTLIWDIGGGFALQDADSAEFARCHAVYRPDPFLRDEPEQLLQLFCAGAPCKWILLDGARVGGILAGGGVIGQFFTVPPFERRAEALRRVALALRSRDGGRIFAHGVTMAEVDDYFRLGFRLTASAEPFLQDEEPDYSWQFMRAMVRPVTPIVQPACSASLRSPRKTDQKRIAALLKAAYGGTDPMRQEEQSFAEDVAQFFAQGDRAMREASSLATSQGRPVGCCLIVRWEGAPLLFDIAVHPDARLGGIARAMVARAVDALHAGGERRLRLFVECGNPAESLYNAMGFVAGPKTTSMLLDS